MPPTPPHRPSVSVVVPLLDDAAGVRDCLLRVLGQRMEEADIVEVVVADGGSTDGSRRIVASVAEADPRVRLIENPDRFAPSALNRAIAETTGDVIVRVDSHTIIDESYVDTAVRVLAETGADVVGGAMRPEGRTPFGQAVTWALSSRWGVGGSRFHRPDEEGETDGVYMGAFRRDTFVRFGLFNPGFLRNQDDEFTYRVREQGGRVWLSSAIRSTYTPRHSARALFRQFRGYGRYKPLVLLAHPSGARLRHVLPSAAALAWLLLPAALRWRRAALPAAVHATTLGLAAAPGVGGSTVHRFVALGCMHLGYGIGFLQGLAALVRGERPGRPPDGSGVVAPSRGGQPIEDDPRGGGRPAVPAPPARDALDTR